ncbi:MAG: indolepyruvate oxidoreductase subunit beta [candidate division Zixibacteria bacterium]|nr:indolepyruvate oxidoreductase subunit beta [candidate division Zixibacteria bacterium]
MTKTMNILIVGVGGQGVLLASEILSEAAMNAGYDVKKSEIHGMSQRGGVVSSHVRIGPVVYSPTIGEGQVDVLMAFEQAEGFRAVNWLKRDGIAILSRTSLIPAIVTGSKQYHYPEDAVADMGKIVKKVIGVEADKIAGELGNPRLVNTILLGVLSNYMPLDLDLWTDTIKSRVKPKLVEVNLKAFQRGRDIRLTAVSA